MKKKNSSLKTNFEKALSVLLSVLMLFTLLPATAYAAASPVVEESSITQGGTDAENGSGSSAAAAGGSAVDNAAADNVAEAAVNEGSSAAQTAAGAESDTPENALVGASDAAAFIFDVGEGNVTIKSGATAGKLTVTYGAAQTVTAEFDNTQKITLTGGTKDAPTANTVTVENGVTANITADGLYIDTSATSGSCALMIQSGAAVNLTLKNENTFKSGANAAGIGVPEGAVLTVTEESDGKATATGGAEGAGIGGGNVGSSGTVTVNGGTVMAIGGSGSAGIGGGNVGSSGTVTVNGGTVTATGGSLGAGIGGGYKGNGGAVTVNGGTVTATGSESDGAGIGGGYKGNGGTVTVSGGTVTATGGGNGAGIGGGKSGDGGTVTVSGGTVTAVTAAGPFGGAGIGGGKSGDGGTVTVSGGTVTATGGDYGAGIGGGDGGSGGIVTVSGGTVTATGGDYGAGIGDGYDGSGGTFSTGENGNAVIVASSISDQSGKASTSATPWSGLIIEGTTGALYGTSVTPTADFTVPAGDTVAIEKDDSTAQTLTVASGITMTNNGDITVKKGDSLVIDGTLVNNGTITIEDGATLVNSGTTTIKDGGTMVNNGGITNNSGAVITNNGVVSGSGTVANDGTITPKTLPNLTAPTVTLCTSDTVTLKDELSAYTSFRYAKGDASSAAYSEWQKSPSFTGLTADTVYTFYAKYDTTEAPFYSYTGTAESSGTAVRTRLGKYTIDVSKGAVTVKKSPQGGNRIYVVCGESQTEDFDYTAQAVTLTGGTKDVPTANTVTVETGVTANITTDGLYIDASATENSCAFMIRSGAAVNLTLQNENTFKSGANAAGIGVPEGAVLTVTEKSDGSVTTTGGDYGAGIGGGQRGGGGTVTVNDGTVTATGGSFGGAGIGGGADGNGGMVTVTGGTFSTGENGNAVIVASSISDQSGKASTSATPWSGLIIEGTTGALYGTSVTPTADFTVPAGDTVAIEKDDSTAQTLTVASGIRMINNGDITVKKGDSLVNDGTLDNYGTITIEEGATLVNIWLTTIYDRATLVNNGGITNNSSAAIRNYGDVSGSGTVANDGEIFPSTLNESAVPAAPTAEKVTSVSVTLKDELPAVTYFRYAKGDASSVTYSGWQKSPSFTGLTADTVYTFYAKYDTTESPFYSYTGTAESSGTAVRTRLGKDAGYTFDVSKGSVTVKKSPQGGNLIYVVCGDSQTEDFDYTEQAITLIGGTKDAPTANTVTVENGVTANITTDGLYIDTSATSDSCAFMIQSGAAVNLTLKNENTFKSGGNDAGIGVPEGAELTVTEESDGSVTAAGGYNGAGIGGGDQGNGGTVTVSGGTVTATGGYLGAGIGGGEQGNGGTVTVSGGTVTAAGGNGGAGIGGGYLGSGGTVTVSGGTVTATGGSYGAGIGGGSNGNGGTVTVSGGIATAAGGSYGAGIGGGFKGNGGTVTVSGGTVTATGSSYSAGIGDGLSGNGGTFSTGENGNAVIVASSISDQSGKASTSTTPWSGLIIEGTAGALYGTSVTPTADFTVPAGDTVAIEKDDGAAQTLTVASGITMTNDGDITVKRGDSLVIDGTLVNNGSISIEDGGTVVNHGTITRKTLPALTAPEVIAHTKTSVALKAVTTGVPRYGYTTGSGKSSSDVDNWQASPVFTDLAENTDYIFYVKYTGSEDYYIYSDTVKKDTPGAGTEFTTDGFAFNASDGSVIVRPDPTDADKIYVVYGNILTTEPFSKTENITLSGGTKEFPTSNTVTVENGVTANITTDGLCIDTSATSFVCAFMIQSGAAVNLTLKNENTFKSGENAAGIGVPEGAALNVTEKSDGSVTAGGIGGAGIGSGDYGGSGGTVTVSGGTVTAIGSEGGAGIGGFGYRSSGGTVTVSGGTVTAIGGTDAAGIGGGDSGSGGTFSTGENGNAVILASSISDQSGKASTSTTPWSGLILEKNSAGNYEGSVYGTTVTPTENFEIPSGAAATIPAGKTLALADGITMGLSGTLTDYGTLKVGDKGVLNINGTAGTLTVGGTVSEGGSGAAGTLENRGAINVKNGGSLIVAAAGNAANLEKTESGTGSTGSGTGSGTGTSASGTKGTLTIEDGGTVVKRDQAAPVLNAADIATDNTTVTLKAVPDDISHGSAKYGYAASFGASAGAVTWTADGSNTITGLTDPRAYYFYEMYDATDYYNASAASVGIAGDTQPGSDYTQELYLANKNAAGSAAVAGSFTISGIFADTAAGTETGTGSGTGTGTETGTGSGTGTGTETGTGSGTGTGNPAEETRVLNVNSAEAFSGKMVPGNVYTIKETMPAAGYVCISEFMVRMTAAGTLEAVKKNTDGTVSALAASEMPAGVSIENAKDTATGTFKMTVTVKNGQNVLTLVKKGPDGKVSLLGAAFTVTPFGTNTLTGAASAFADGTTDAVTLTNLGTASLTGGLAAGSSYVIEETTAPAGYRTFSGSITVTAGKDGRFTYSDGTAGPFLIDSTDKADIGVSVSESGSLSGGTTGGTTGSLSDGTAGGGTGSLPGGNAAVTGDTAVVTVRDQENSFTVAVENASGTKLAGAAMALKNADGTGTLLSWISSSKEVKSVIYEMAAGTVYRLVEETPIAGYIAAADIFLKMDNAGNLSTGAAADGDYTEAAGNAVTVTNTQNTFALEETEGDGGAKVSGAVFRLTGDFFAGMAEGTKEISMKTLRTETVKLIGKLAAGQEYRLTAETPADGFVLTVFAENYKDADTDSGALVLKEDKAGQLYYRSTDQGAVFADDGAAGWTKISGNLISIVGIKNSMSAARLDGSGNAVAGASLVISDAAGTEIETWQTAAGSSQTNPHKLTGKLAAGTIYVLKETATPFGYATPAAVYLRMSADGQLETSADGQIWTATDRSKANQVVLNGAAGGGNMAGLMLKVTDAVNGTGVADTEFTLTHTPTDGSSPVQKVLATDADGVLRAADLLKGKYTLTQAKENENYSGTGAPLSVAFEVTDSCGGKTLEISRKSLDEAGTAGTTANDFSLRAVSGTENLTDGGLKADPLPGTVTVHVTAGGTGSTAGGSTGGTAGTGGTGSTAGTGSTGSTADGVNGVTVELRKAADGSIAAAGPTADGSLTAGGITAGVVHFTDLAWGDYYLSVTAVPEGYEAVTSHYNVTIGAGTLAPVQEITLTKKPAALIEAGGIYTFRSMLDRSRVLDISNASDAQAANLQLWTDNGTDAQKFIAIKNDDGYWEFAAYCSGRVLDAAGGRAENGTNVRQYTDNGTAAQEWSIRYNDDGSITFISRLGDFAIDIAGSRTARGTNAQLYGNSGENNQRFLAEKVGTVSLKPGWYTLTSALDSSKCLDLSGNVRADGGKIQLYGRNGTAAQRFYLAYGRGGAYRLLPGDGYAVDVSGAGKAAGTPVQLYTNNYTAAQNWFVEKNSDGTVSLKSACNGLYMDVQNAGTKNGTQIQCWTGNGTAAQKWQLTPVK